MKEGTASRPDCPLSPVKLPLRKKKKTEEIQDNNRNEEIKKEVQIPVTVNVQWPSKDA